MTEKEEKPNYRLDVMLSVKRKNGMIINVSTRCDNWNLMQKFINDFENTLIEGNNGKT